MHRLAKLRGRSFDELLVRGTQALTATVERLAPADDERPTSMAHLRRRLIGNDQLDAADLLREFRSGDRVPFFGLADRAASSAALRRHWPDAEAEIVARAERIARGEFDVLGLRGVSYGHPIDWHLDPVTGRRAPRDHWSRVPYLDYSAVGDHKVIWELNRHQHLVTLGQAYWLGGDERYAELFVEHVTTWMDENQPKRGINWASSLELSFRMISWFWALHYFRDSAALTAGLHARLLQSLYVHARHVETYLSTYFSPNTHLTGEALGLLYAGTLLPRFRRAHRWRAVGWRTLVERLRHQVRPDGVYFEQTTYYQRYTVDFYLHALLLAEANGIPVEAGVREAVARLADHLMYLTRPDGRTPMLGDDDGGRLVPLERSEPDDFRGTLAVAAAVLGRRDHAAVAGPPTESVLWLLGPDGVDRLTALGSAPPARSSADFSAGGYFVMRDGWSPRANYAVIDCGPHGSLNGAHAHADALAIELCARGRPMLVDAGTYTYMGPERNAFRGTAAHNTLTIDGQPSAVPAGPFRWSTMPRGVLRAWATTERFDYFDGEHHGYLRLPSSAMHRRAILFLRGRYWILRDDVRSEGTHRLELRFHAAPGLEARRSRGDAVTLHGPAPDAPRLTIATCGGDGAYEVQPGWVSPAYGARTPAAVCSYATVSHGAHTLVTVLAPSEGDEPDPRVSAVPAGGGRALAIHGAGTDDLVLLGDGGHVRTDAAESDALWCWIARQPETGTPLEFLMIGGSMLRLDGRDLVDGDRRGDWLAGRRVGGEWRLERGDFTPARGG